MEDTDLTQREPNDWPLPHTVADAAERGDLQAVKAWLARPSSYIDAMDGSRWTLLHHACLSFRITAENVAVAEYLLSRGASVNHGDTSVLHCAVARHCISYPTDMVGLLLRAGSHIDARDDEGDSPIAWAMDAMRSDRSERELTRALECVVQLLRHGASLADGHFGFKNDGNYKSFTLAAEKTRAIVSNPENSITNKELWQTWYNNTATPEQKEGLPQAIKAKDSARRKEYNAFQKARRK